MKKIVFALTIISSIVLGFELLLSGGYTFVEKRGWNLKIGFLEYPFESDVGVSFDFEQPHTLMCFDVDVYFPLFDFSLFRSGPVLIYIRDNYSGGWSEFAGLGAFVQIDNESFTLRGGLLYPITEEFDFQKNVMYELRYYMRPPKGKRFKDKLFVELVYHYGFFRFGIGLIEPIP